METNELMMVKLLGLWADTEKAISVTWPVTQQPVDENVKILRGSQSTLTRV